MIINNEISKKIHFILQEEISSTKNAITNYSNLSDSWGQTAKRNEEFADRLEAELDNCAVEYIA